MESAHYHRVYCNGFKFARLFGCVRLGIRKVFTSWNSSGTFRNHKIRLKIIGRMFGGTFLMVWTERPSEPVAVLGAGKAFFSSSFFLGSH